MQLYFLYFHFSRKGDIFWIFGLDFSTFYCLLEVFVLHCIILWNFVLYSCIIDKKKKKKIAVGGLTWFLLLLSIKPCFQMVCLMPIYMKTLFLPILTSGGRDGECLGEKGRKLTLKLAFRLCFYSYFKPPQNWLSNDMLTLG